MRNPRRSRALPPISFRSAGSCHCTATQSWTSSSTARHTIIVENNYSGQFARYLRSETSFVPDGYIRKYDGEPFMPHHIVEAVKEQLTGKTTLSVPDARNHGLRRSKYGDSSSAATKHVTMPDFKGKVDPDWCPGCGDFGVLAAVQKALVELQIQPTTW